MFARVRQSPVDNVGDCEILDFPVDSAIQKIGHAEILDIFNKVMVKATEEGNPVEQKLRTVEKLANKGFLGEFLQDEGAKWLTHQKNADAFISALGKDGDGAHFKKRNHLVIAFYVPLNLNTDSPGHLKEIEEVNNILLGVLVNLCWIKPPAQRAPTQTCRHLVLTFANPDAANRAKTMGLIICNKRVSVSKYKKEPIRCLKCQGWNHIVAECILNVDICGTCGVRGHRTSACTNTNATHCRSCDTDDRTSWARDCPTFIRKCQEYNVKHLENGLPYYPSLESWTWSMSTLPLDPANRFRVEGGPLICQAASLKQLRQCKLQFRSKAIGEVQDPRTGTPLVRPPFPHPEQSNLFDIPSETLLINANPSTHI